MSATKGVNWLHFKKEKTSVLYCSRCGQTHDINAVLPLPLDCMLDLIKVFKKAHGYCKEREPKE